MSRARSARVSRRGCVAHEMGVQHSEPQPENVRAQSEIGTEDQVHQHEDFKSGKVAQEQTNSNREMLQTGSDFRRARVKNETCVDGLRPMRRARPMRTLLHRCPTSPNGKRTREAFQPSGCGKEAEASFFRTAHHGNLQSLKEAMSSDDWQSRGDDLFKRVRSTSSETALMSAAAGGRVDITDFLISKNVFVNAADVEGNAASNHALDPSGERVALVQVSVSARSDLQANHVHGDTPLALPSIIGDMLLDAALVKSGANVNVQDNEGLRPFDYAKHLGCDEVARSLKDAGAEGCPIEMDELSGASDLDIDDVPDTASFDVRDALPTSINLLETPACATSKLRVNADMRTLSRKCLAAGNGVGLQPMFLPPIPPESPASFVNCVNHVSASPCDTQAKERQARHEPASSTKVSSDSRITRTGRVALRPISCPSRSCAKQHVRKLQPLATE